MDRFNRATLRADATAGVGACRGSNSWSVIARCWAGDPPRPGLLFEAMTIAPTLAPFAGSAAHRAGGQRCLQCACNCWRSNPAAGLSPNPKIPSLATLGNLFRTMEGLRVTLRSHLLATNQMEQARGAAGL